MSPVVRCAHLRLEQVIESDQRSAVRGKGKLRRNQASGVSGACIVVAAAIGTFALAVIKASRRRMSALRAMSNRQVPQTSRKIIRDKTIGVGVKVRQEQAGRRGCRRFPGRPPATNGHRAIKSR